MLDIEGLGGCPFDHLLENLREIFSTCEIAVGEDLVSSSLPSRTIHMKTNANYT
jgi:hypothetical protein